VCEECEVGVDVFARLWFWCFSHGLFFRRDILLYLTLQFLSVGIGIERNQYDQLHTRLFLHKLLNARFRPTIEIAIDLELLLQLE